MKASIAVALLGSALGAVTACGNASSPNATPRDPGTDAPGGVAGESGGGSGGGANPGGTANATGGATATGGGGGAPDTGGAAGSDGTDATGGQSDGGAAGAASGAGGAGATGGCRGACEPVACEGTFRVTSDEEFSEFVALGCTTVTEDLQITQTNRSSLSGLAIESIGRNLVIAANSELTTLAGLERVTHVGATLTIISNARLSSLSPLSTWPADAVVESISIQLNPTLPQCEVEALDAHLAAPCSNCINNHGEGGC